MVDVEQFRKQAHVIESSEFLNLRQCLDLGKDLVRYFKSVLDRRKENEDRN